AELKENFNGMSIEIRKKEKLLQEEQWAYLSTHPSIRLTSFCFDDDDDEDYTFAITPDKHVLYTEEPDNSLNQIEDFSESNQEFSSIDDDSFFIDTIDYIEAPPPDSELVSSEVMEIVIPEVGGIDDDILLTIEHDDLREKLRNVNLLISKIEALNANPTLPSDCKTKSSSTSLLEETNTFDNSLPEFETFCFDVEEISSGSTTARLDLFLLEYKAFHDDHVKEISSGIVPPYLLSLRNKDIIFDPGICKSTFSKPDISHRCGTPQFPFNYKSESGYIENYNSYPYDSSSIPQQYPCCTRCGGPHETCQCDQLIFDEPYCKHCGGPHMIFQCQPMNQDSYNSNSLDFDQPRPPQSLVIHQPPQELSIQKMKDLKQQKKEKLLQLEQWAYLSTHPSKRLNSFCYDDDDEEDYTITDEVISSSVENLIPIPSESEGIPEHMCDVPFNDNSSPLDVLKDQIKDFSESNDEFSSIDDDSFSIDNINYVEASPPDSELVSSEVMEIVIPEVGGIDDDILLTIKNDILHEKLLNVNLLIAKIEALNANPTSSSDCKTKSSSTSLNSLLEETNTFDNSLPEFETFCFDVEEISSESTTTHSDISLLEYEVFYDDHIKEISSGSLTTHYDSSLYASFIFDLLVNLIPPTDRSDFYEFTDELIPFISPPKYDCFLFKIEPNSRDFTKDVV
nr:hypothetical protein [Tanacetum cinerariifolium]